MRILFLALDVNIKNNTGDSIHVKELAKSLASLGHKVSLVVPDPGNSENLLPPSKQHKNLQIFFFRPRSHFRSISTVLFCKKVAKDQRAEVIYERRFTPKIGYSLNKLLGIPLLVEINGLRDKEKELQQRVSKSQPRFKGFRRRLWHHFFRSVARVVVVSAGLKRGLIKEYGIDGQKIKVIYNGANTEMFKPLDKKKCFDELNLNVDIRYIGFIGNLAPWQGVEQLIEIAPKILNTHPDVRFIIVGDGILGNQLRKQASDLGIEDKVIFTGFVPYEDVPKYINSFEVCAAPFSGIERNVRYSFSAIKLYEYMACGKPVVTTDVVGMKKDMQDLGLGMIVKADDKAGLGSSISLLLSNKDMQTAMGERARAWVIAEHGWKNVAERVANLCKAQITGTTTI
jgi:glycosyltransferase involved in cell wall biosynthesis